MTRQSCLSVFAASSLLSLGMCVTLVHAQSAAPLVRSPVAKPLAVRAVTSAEPIAEPEKFAVAAGKTLDGQPFDLQALRGKVVLVMLWSSGCAMCRDRMPELRDNIAAWKGKPFEIVAISHDRKRDDLLTYQQVIASAVKPNQRFPWVWAGEAEYKDNLGKPASMPMSYLIDKNGKVVKSFAGRMPAEVWDQIADMVY